MASPTYIAAGTSTSNAFSTGALTAGATGSRRVVLVAAADSGSYPTNLGVTGGGVTFAEEDSEQFRSRRFVAIATSDGAATTTALTITITVPNTFQECHWVVVDVPNFSSFGTPANLEGGGGLTAFSAPDVGTIGANDFALFVAGQENASDGLDVDANSTQVYQDLTGDNIRSIVVGYSTTDDTPGVVWTTAGDAQEVGIVAILCATTGGGGATFYTTTELTISPYAD